MANKADVGSGCPPFIRAGVFATKVINVHEGNAASPDGLHDICTRRTGFGSSSNGAEAIILIVESSKISEMDALTYFCWYPYT